MSEIDISAPVDDSQTTFPHLQPLKTLGEMAKAVDEHYAAQNEINKGFDDPRGHIWKKYHNRRYPYYVKGLTNMEREIVCENETRVLNGMQPTVCAYDPVLQEKFGGKSNVLVRDMEYNQEVRDAIKNSINQIFEQNNIVIPDDVD